MAFVGGSRAAFTNFASKARASVHSFRTAGLSPEIALGSGGRSMPGTCPVPSSFSRSRNALEGNRRSSSFLPRPPKGAACAQSLLPLYSVTASSRLVSQLSTNAMPFPANLHDDFDGT